MSFDLGDVLDSSNGLSVYVFDSNGNAANAGAVTLTITLPDGTTTTPAVSNPSTGVYTATYTPATVGVYEARWVATGVNASAFTDTFVIRSGTAPSALSLADAKRYLNITDTDDDEELREFIEAAEAALGRRCGYVVPTTVTERVRGCGNRLMLKEKPLISVTSVTAVGMGTTVDVSQLTALPSGSVEFSIAGSFYARFYDVVYRAGRNPLPADLYKCLQEITKHLWQTQRGPGRKRDEVMGAAYAFTYRVKELWEPYVVNETMWHVR